MDPPRYSHGALGVALKRQVPLGERYVADFFAPSVGVIVEVDGGVHRGSCSEDTRRDGWLRCRGYRVVRVTAELVLRDAQAALALVSAAVQPHQLSSAVQAGPRHRCVLNYRISASHRAEMIGENFRENPRVLRDTEGTPADRQRAAA